MIRNNILGLCAIRYPQLPSRGATSREFWEVGFVNNINVNFRRDVGFVNRINVNFGMQVNL